MTAVTYPAAFAASLIGGYQRFVSPYKGFCCAYRTRTKRASCSEFARRVALRRGLLALPGLLRERFKRCAAAARAMTHRRHDEQQRTRRPSRFGESCVDAAGDACVYGACDPAPCDIGAADACGCGGIDL
jgi:putative component of membrane protein insertase Oxa1/YidC/SpoIIIJ protein YidD